MGKCYTSWVAVESYIAVLVSISQVKHPDQAPVPQFNPPPVSRSGRTTIVSLTCSSTHHNGGRTALESELPPHVHWQPGCASPVLPVWLPYSNTEATPPKDKRYLPIKVSTTDYGVPKPYLGSAATSNRATPFPSLLRMPTPTSPPGCLRWQMSIGREFISAWGSYPVHASQLASPKLLFYCWPLASAPIARGTSFHGHTRAVGRCHMPSPAYVHTSSSLLCTSTALRLVFGSVFPVHQFLLRATHSCPQSRHN